MNTRGLIPTDKERSFRVEKEFGLIVGGVFTLLGAWWLYRGKFVIVSQVFLVLGVMLILLGLTFPRSLVYPNKAWMSLAEALGYVMTRVILGVIFFILVTPIGVGKRLLGWDPLRRRAKSGTTYWQPYPKRQRDTHHYEKMY